MKKIAELVSGLIDVLFFLFFNCYTGDEMQKEKVIQLSKNIRNVIDYLDGRENKNDTI